MEQNQIIKRNEAAVFLGCSTRTLDRMIESGRIPRPIRFTQKVSGWPQNTFVAWLDEMLREADSKQPAAAFDLCVSGKKS